MAGENIPMRVVVTGRKGQVARALAERCAVVPGMEVIFAARPEFNFARPENLAEGIRALAPDIVVNAAAYTGVDKAESEPELAMTVNAHAAGEVARGAGLFGAPVIQISTDYVFDGSSDRPYRENDRTGPLNVYGKSKLEGEVAVRAATANHFIIRTSWVYSPFGNNFLTTMLRLASSKDKISVVADQIGNPSSAFDIAEAIMHVIRKYSALRHDVPYGTYHMAGSGETSWHGFAEAIFAQARPYLISVPELNAIPTSEYETDAVRPANSRMDSKLFEHSFAYRAPDWRSSLANVISRAIGDD